MDGIKNKIGFNKRSFAEWGSQISQSFQEGGRGLRGFKDALSAAFTTPKTVNSINLIPQSDFEIFFEDISSNDFFNYFNEDGSKSLSTLTQWCNQFDKLDDNMRSYLVDCMQKQVPASYQNYEAYTKKAIKANEQLSLSTKAGQTALKTLAAAGNMAVFALLTQAVSVASTAIDNYIHRVEYANKAMDDAVSACETTQSELESINSELEENNKQMAELQKKDHLTYVEKGQLKELQDITKELLLQQDIEEKKLDREQKDAASKAVEAYEEQYGDYDISDTAINEHLDYINITNKHSVAESEDDISGNIAELLSFQALLDETAKKLENTEALSDDEVQYLSEEAQSYVDTITDINNNLENSIADLAEKKSALAPEYQKAIEKQANGELLTTEDNEVIAHYEQISEQIKLIYEYTNPDEWNHIQLSDLFNTDGLEKSKDELLAMAKAGELTPDTINGYTHLNKALAESDLILEGGQTSAEAFCNELYALAENMENVEPPNTENLLNDTFAAFQNSASVMQEFQSAMASNQLTDSLLSSVGSLSTELNEMVAGFYAGTVSADQLYQALSDHYNTDLQNYGNAIIAKNQYNEAFYNSLGLANTNFINSFAKNYGIDLQNCKNYNQAKLQIENHTLNTLGSWWSRYYDTQSMSFNAEGEKLLSHLSASGNAESQKQYAEIMKKTSAYKSASNTLKNITDGKITETFNEITNPFENNSGNSTSAKTETKETFNFIETAITHVESAIDRVKSKAGEAFNSFKSRSKAYSDAIAKITGEISIQEQAKQQYTSNRDNVGLSEEWAAQVRDGSLSIAEIGDSALKEQIRKYQEWNDKVNECDKSIEDLKKEQKELVNENIELLITKYEKLAARASNAVQRTQNRIDLKEALGGSANIRNYISMNEGLSKQIGYIREQNKELKEQQKNVPKCSEAWYEYQEQIDSNTASVQNLTKSMVENARAAASLAGEKADKNVEQYDSKDELYDAKIANAATAKQKNNLIDKKVKNIDKRQEEYEKAVVTSTDNLNSSASEIQRMKSKKTNTNNKTANAQNKTYNAVLKKVKAQISSGRKIGDSLLNQAYQLNDNYELWNACIQYNEYFDAKEKNKTIADLYAETSKQEKADLASEKFNNTSSEYDNKLRSGEQKKTAANNRISLANAQGKQASASDYEELIDIEQDQQKILINKRDALEQAFHDAVNKGSIKEGSDEWYEMLEAIQAVTDEIDESTQSLVEHQNALRQLEWDKFDDEMETFQRRNSNRDYQINMLSHKELVDDETGSFTDEGNATLSLRKSNYQDYLTQAAKYRQEYEKLQTQIAKGELSAEDENVIARLRELEDAHHDAMLSAEEEKDSIADLIKEGYQAQLNTLSELIQKYKDLRQSEKDAYEYQKSIAEKTKNIASLQKQLAAYGTNDTEEARAKIQQIKVDLENARQDLKDTEYEKYLSDTNDMLDELYNDYEAFIDEKLNNTDELLANLDISINNMSADVITALNSIHVSNETLLQALGSSDIPPTLSRDSGGTPRISVSSPITDNFGRGLISESAGYANPVNISIGDIILQDVQNPEQFSRQLIEIIADNSKVQRTIQAVSVDRLASGSTLSVKRFK